MPPAGWRGDRGSSKPGTVPPGSGSARQSLARRTAMLATIARFCVRRRRWVLAAWMLLFVAGIAIGSMVFGRLHDSNGGAGTESVQGSAIVQQASSIGPAAVVLVKGAPVAAASTRASVQALTARLERLP